MTYHRYECGRIALLHQLGIAFLGSFHSQSILEKRFFDSLSAFRTLTNNDPSEVTETSTRVGSDYRSICQLLSHSESMSVDDAFHYSLTGYFLLSLLEGTPYSTIDRILLGSNLVDHIEQMICNAQTMSISCANNADQHVASAILPVCALMNHSCLPNIRCLYHQGYFHVYARQVIVQGEEICNCYGPEQALIPSTAERQRLLFDQYFVSDAFYSMFSELLSAAATNSSLNVSVKDVDRQRRKTLLFTNHLFRRVISPSQRAWKTHLLDSVKVTNAAGALRSSIEQIKCDFASSNDNKILF